MPATLSSMKPASQSCLRSCHIITANEAPITKRRRVFLLKFTDVSVEANASVSCSEEPLRRVGEFLPVNSRLHSGRQEMSATAGGVSNLE